LHRHEVGVLRLRVITALTLLGLLVAALWLGRVTFVVAAALLFAGAIFEWLRLAGLRTGTCVLAAFVIVTGLVALEVAGRTPTGSVLTLVCAGATAVWLTLLAVLVRAGQHGVRLGRNLSTVLGLTLLPAAWFALLYLHQIGIVMLFSTLAIVWVADIAAYFAGRRFGKRKLAPRISPGKTWAGVGGAVLGVLALSAVVHLVWPHGQLLSNALFDKSLLLALLLLALLVATSIVGDLFESLLKRQAGRKDSSQLLPGHGGVLDRIDALVPVLPVAVLIQRWIQ
jgi:phosphatidate cytidylyltransferase